MNAGTLNEVSLKVAGRVYGGWKEAGIRRALDSLAGDFSLRVSERWPGDQKPLALAPGDRCALAIGDDTVIDGYIDEVQPFYDAERHGVSLRGRDVTGDLVDCAAEHAGGEWTNRPLVAIVGDLIRPFGIKLLTNVPSGANFARFAIDQGETVFEAIERACRMRGVLATSNGQGALVLTRSGADGAGTALIFGENILSARGLYSQRDRFSVYRAVGQDSGTDAIFGEKVAAPDAKVFDEAVTRYRPQVIVAEAKADAAQLKTRAQWEARVRAARARRAQVTVQGWRDGAGLLWRPNTTTPVRDAFLGLDARMLIVGVEYSVSAQSGRRTILDLAREGAFEPLPLRETADEGLGW